MLAAIENTSHKQVTRKLCVCCRGDLHNLLSAYFMVLAVKLLLILKKNKQTPQQPVSLKTQKHLITFGIL